jgi:hypothetical protein
VTVHVVGTLVLLHNGGFCNGCITKGCLLLISTNVSYNDFVSQLILEKDESNKKYNTFCHVQNNIVVSHEGKAHPFCDVCNSESTVK